MKELKYFVCGALLSLAIGNLEVLEWRRAFGLKLWDAPFNLFHLPLSSARDLFVVLIFVAFGLMLPLDSLTGWLVAVKVRLVSVKARLTRSSDF